MKIEINGQEWEFRYNWGSVYTFEQITGKNVSDIRGTMDLHVLFYSMLLYNNRERWTMTFDEFVEAIENYGVLQKMNEVYQKEMRLRQVQMSEVPAENGSVAVPEKKKVRRKI